MAKRWMTEIVGKSDRLDGTRSRQMIDCGMSPEVLPELPRNS
jgi:hypothetical protein